MATNSPEQPQPEQPNPAEGSLEYTRQSLEHALGHLSSEEMIQAHHSFRAAIDCLLALGHESRVIDQIRGHLIGVLADIERASANIYGAKGDIVAYMTSIGLSATVSGAVLGQEAAANREPQHVLPDPMDIVRRAAVRTGQAWLHPDIAPPRPSERSTAEFGVTGYGNGVGNAAVRIETRPAEGQPAGSSVVRTTFMHIGYYDPATSQWKLYPEYIEPNEQQEVTAVMESEASIEHSMLGVEIEAGGPPFADLRDPLTVRARQELGELANGTGIAERIIRDNPVAGRDRTRSTDQSTTYTMNFEVNGNEGADVEGQRTIHLAITYYGLIARRVKDGVPVIERQHRSIRIATRSHDDPDVWIPDLALVSMDEWERLQGAITRLKSYRLENSDFSPYDACAVIRHI